MGGCQWGGEKIMTAFRQDYKSRGVVPKFNKPIKRQSNETTARERKKKLFGILFVI